MLLCGQMETTVLPSITSIFKLILSFTGSVSTTISFEIGTSNSKHSGSWTIVIGKFVSFFIVKEAFSLFIILIQSLLNKNHFLFIMKKTSFTSSHSLYLPYRFRSLQK